MTWWSVSLVAFAVTVAGHALLCRMAVRAGIIAKFLQVSAAVGVVLGGAMVGFWGNKPETLTAVLVYAFLCELYVFLFTLTNSSVSASLLLTLASVSEADEAEVEARYSSQRMVLNRLHRLEKNGFLELTADGVYRITWKGCATINLFDWMRRFFRHNA